MVYCVVLQKTDTWGAKATCVADTEASGND
jgi:hypothetical protein